MQGAGEERSSTKEWCSCIKEWSLETTSIHGTDASYEIWGKFWNVVLFLISYTVDQVIKKESLMKLYEL